MGDKTVFIRGKKIDLVPLSASASLERYESWINDQDTTQFMGSGMFPVTIDGLKNYIESFRNNSGLLLGIYDKGTFSHVGNITLHMINWKDRNAEVGLLIGEKNVRGRGYATEAIKLVSAHAFNKLNLHRLTAGVVRGNDASKRAFEKNGYQVEGVLRQHFFLRDCYHDVYRLGLLQEDFESTLEGQAIQ